MKSMQELKAKLKGEGNEEKVIAKKGAFSAASFSELVHTMVNDPDYKFTWVDKGETLETNLRELFVGDVKKTLANAKYPQESEIDVLNNVEICTTGLTDAISPIIGEWLSTGKKFPLKTQPTFNGAIYLSEVPGTTRTVNVRDIKTGEQLGTSTSISKDSVAVRVKSTIPSHLVTKIRKNLSGQVVEKE